jgi:hypothetical protein
MVLEKQRPRGEFHARMKEVDEGLYCAEYSGEINPENSNQQDIPDYHLGTSIAEVKSGLSRWPWVWDTRR